MTMTEQPIRLTDGGVCAPKGFRAAGIHCGIRHNNAKKDLALIVSEVPCAAAGVYTKNLVKGAPLKVSRAHLANGQAQAIFCNSGNANTCNANGEAVAEEMSALLAEAISIPTEDVVVASTGVIGLPLSLDPIRNGLPEIVGKLSKDGSADAAEGIMTTDTKKKEVAVSFSIGDTVCHIGGVAKGSGMIHPNLATMLVFLTSDVSIEPALLQKALSADITDSFNMVSIDGDTSTNDMVVILANGMAENPKIMEEGEDYRTFSAALRKLTLMLCQMIAEDGEGATKFLTCAVTGAKDKDNARLAAKSVICSSLVKTAMFGADANWGRVLCAIGYSGADTDIEAIDLSFRSEAGKIEVCRNGRGVAFSEEKAKEILLKDRIEILVTMHEGDAEATAFGCDLTYDYVKINGDYRT